jgi:pyridoxamine 5'-phosphate oxidase
MIDPFQLFQKWYSEESQLSDTNIPSACCLSTIGLDGFPNARFVSLKGIVNEGFIVTGPLNSRKAMEIKRSNKTALTFWWPVTERQVRVQGEAAGITDQQADEYFAEREIDSQIVSLISEQGKEIERLEQLENEYREVAAQSGKKRIPRPGTWSGFSIKPLRIEFMEFKPTRLHDRKLYELASGKWSVKQIQP